jgi:hypothetical protein
MPITRVSKRDPAPHTRTPLWLFAAVGVGGLVVGGIVVASSQNTKAAAGPQAAAATVTVPVPGPTHTVQVTGSTITRTVPLPVPGPTSTIIKRVPVPGPTSTVTRTVSVPQTYRTVGNGTYVIGTDIPGGIYKTAGPSTHGAFDSCYWAVLNSLDTNDIADNGNIDGPTTIQANGHALELSGGCTWTRIA